jgi:plasmid maintenance system killer protein
MDVEFQNQVIERFFTGAYFGKQKFSGAIFQSFRHKISLMENSLSMDELSKIRSLNIEKFENGWSARFNDRYRLEFDFIKPDLITIIKISKYYEK